PHGQELARPVGEDVVQFGGNVEDQGTGLVGLAHHLGDPHLVAGALGVHGARTSTRPSVTAASMLARRLARVAVNADDPPAAILAETPAHVGTASGVHGTLVCCRLNLATSTTAPHRPHAPSAYRHARSSAGVPRTSAQR